MTIDNAYSKGLLVATIIVFVSTITFQLLEGRTNRSVEHLMLKEMTSMLSESQAIISDISSSFQDLAMMKKMPQRQESEPAVTPDSNQLGLSENVSSTSTSDRVSFFSRDTSSADFRQQNATQVYQKASLDTERQIGWVLDQVDIAEPRRSQIIRTLVDAVSENRLLPSNERNTRFWEIAPSEKIRDVLADALTDSEYSRLPNFERDNARHYYRSAFVRSMMYRSQDISYQTAEFLTDQIITSIDPDVLISANYQDFLDIQAEGFEMLISDGQSRLTPEEIDAIEAFMERQALGYPVSN